MFPYYIRGLSGKNCPTIGKNAPMDSNAGSSVMRNTR